MPPCSGALPAQVPFEGSLDESRKYGMGRSGPGLVLGVELATKEERMPGQFHHFDQPGSSVRKGLT